MFESYNDVSRNFYNWCEILEELGGNGNYDDEIWELVRAHNHCPHLGNVRQAVILWNLESEIYALYPSAKVDFYINAIDSHLYINDKIISDMRDFRRITAQYEAENLAA